MSNSYFKPINYYIENKFVCNKKFQDTFDNVKNYSNRRYSWRF